MIFWERQKSLTAFYEACTKPVRDAYDLTQMQFNILMFLHNNPQFDTAGDLVKTRHLTKSHVSTALKELEARGWIEAYYAAGNRKSQHLRITKSAEAVIAAGKAAQEVFGKQLFKKARCKANEALRREKPSSTKCCLTKCAKTPQKA